MEIADELTKSLSVYFNQKNIDSILKKTKDDQRLKIYEILCMINNPEITPKEGLLDAVAMLKKNQLLWNHPTFALAKVKLEEENDFIICPYEISEGILTCRKCGCKKIFSFTKQTRSLDEPTPVFALCSQCGNRWAEGS